MGFSKRHIKEGVLLISKGIFTTCFGSFDDAREYVIAKFLYPLSSIHI